MSHLWSTVVERGGVILQSEGDFLRAFFEALPGEEACTAELVALDVSEEILKKLRALETQLVAQYALTQAPRLEYRASITNGTIRPVWHEAGTTRHAGWVEVGATNVLVESTRLMDLDHVFPTKNRALQSRIVLSEELARGLCERRPQLATRFLARNLSLKGKHGRDYCCAFYLPAEPRIGALRLQAA